MTEERFDTPVADALPVPPRFDDERTLVSARPVVPLEKINAKVRHRRRWLLGGAFAVAMMLGAASAVVAWYLRQRSVPAVATEVSQEEVVTEPFAVAASVPSESPAVETVDEPVTPVASVTAKKEAHVKHRTAAKTDADVELRRDTPKMNENEELQRIREAVLYDPWQERRARRVERQRRKAERYNHRDLSNLDEIFEGRRKP